MNVVALSGGVGGARLLYGLERALPPGELTAIVNTGDDFIHLGLRICPDLDTVMYTLADLGDVERGWGLANESFAAMEMIKRYGGADWFSLGDRDLGTHLLRLEALLAGESLTAITARLCRALSVSATILPMSDGVCPTKIQTESDGTLPFQEWFVRARATPRVKKVRCAKGTATRQVTAALECADLVIISPSNPYVSIDPILSLPGVRARISGKRVVAVSPIVGGAAIKGPLGSMIESLAGVAPSPTAIAHHYGSILRGMVLESGDRCEGLPTLATRTVMRDRNDSVRLGREVLSFAQELS